MLSKLFGSHSRVKILKAFLFHPDERYYIRQLSRDLGLQVNSVRRELENLEDFGLLLSESASGPENKNSLAEEKNSDRQEKKYFRVNKNFPLFEDIKGMIIKSQLFHKEDFTKDLLKAGNIKLLILAGVFVNDFKSPTDVLIVGKVNKDKLLKVVRDLEKELGREVNFTLLTAVEFKYRRDIADIFLYDLLEKEKIIVIDEIGIS
jgi:predicted transcriptional regulator